MPLAWVPPSPRVRCHLACVYLLTTLLDFDDSTIPTNPNPVQLRIILLGAARTGKYRAIDGPGARSALVPALTRRTVRASGASDLSDSARQQKGGVTWGFLSFLGGVSYRIRILMYCDVSCMYPVRILTCPVHVHQDTSRYIRIHLYLHFGHQ